MVTPRKDFFWLVKCEYSLGVIKGLEIKVRSGERFHRHLGKRQLKG